MFFTIIFVDFICGFNIETIGDPGGKAKQSGLYTLGFDFEHRWALIERF